MNSSILEAFLIIDSFVKAVSKSHLTPDKPALFVLGNSLCFSSLIMFLLYSHSMWWKLKQQVNKCWQQLHLTLNGLPQWFCWNSIFVKVICYLWISSEGFKAIDTLIWSNVAEYSFDIYSHDNDVLSRHNLLCWIQISQEWWQLTEFIKQIYIRFCLFLNSFVHWLLFCLLVSVLLVQYVWTNVLDLS